MWGKQSKGSEHYLPKGMRFWLVRNWTWSLKLVRSSELGRESKVWYFKGVGRSLIGHGLALQFSLLLLTSSCPLAMHSRTGIDHLNC